MTAQRKTHAGNGLLLALCMLGTLLVSAAAAQGEEIGRGPATPAEEQLVRIQADNEMLLLKIKQLESSIAISKQLIHQKKILCLKEIAANIKLQRETTRDFEGFAKWMSVNLAGYNHYIQAGSYVAAAAKMLPIPYAGQASIFAKFVAQFTVALNSSSISVTNYLNSSRKFIAMADAIDPGNAPDGKKVAEAALFAERQVLKDMNDAQVKLASISEYSSGALSFLESLNHYAGGADEYWNKAKGLFKKDVDPKEKSFISESATSLKTQADHFNGKLKNFEELGKKESSGVKALAVYDELAADISLFGIDQMASK